MARRNQEHVVPGSKGALDRLKYDVAQDLGLISAGQRDERAFAEFLDRYKYDVATELGLRAKIDQIGWPNMTSRECGKVGGHMGGRLGGQMVRRMIRLAEERMK